MTDDDTIRDVQLRADEVAASMSKHTPGPWGWQGAYLAGPGHYDVIEAEVNRGTHCLGCPVDLCVSDADKALIAAAPEMYAALKAQEALEQFDEKHGTTVADQPSYHFEHARLFDEAQRLRTAALAKAEGREVQR